jgi:2-C-methyl-D-erythritol 4-phosphate cytidylyltransferase
MKTNKFVIIVAGGSGSRMKSGLPKQFIPIGDKPILMHTIQRFVSCFEDITIIVVLPKKYIPFWKDLCVEFFFNIKHTITAGGKTRFESVKNGLQLITGDGIVAVHDGVRPFVTEKTIKQVFEAAAKHGAAIPVISIKDSIRQVNSLHHKSLNRDDYRLVQTPQCFSSAIIHNAYKHNSSNYFTDDATVVEASGIPIMLTEGNYENIKITNTFDLAVAELLTKKRYLI